MTGTIHLQLLLATFAGWIGRQQSAVIAYLIEENRILKDSSNRVEDACASLTISVADWLPRGSPLVGKL